MPHPHIHSPSYAPPVLRPPSPASSIGTSYAPDATSFSDTAAELSQYSFEKKWEDKLRLSREFAREWRGDDDDNDDGDVDSQGTRTKMDKDRDGWGRDPLFPSVEGGMTVAEETCMFSFVSLLSIYSFTLSPPHNTDIHEQILRSLRYHIHQYEQNELFEQTLLARGNGEVALSLEHQPTSTEIDMLMRSMMSLGSPTMGNTSGKDDNIDKTDQHASVGAGNLTVTSTRTITKGPWNRNIGMEGPADVSMTPGPGRRITTKGKGRSHRR